MNSGLHQHFGPLFVVVLREQTKDAKRARIEGIIAKRLFAPIATFAKTCESRIPGCDLSVSGGDAILDLLSRDLTRLITRVKEWSHLGFG